MRDFPSDIEKFRNNFPSNIICIPSEICNQYLLRKKVNNFPSEMHDKSFFRKTLFRNSYSEIPKITNNYQLNLPIKIPKFSFRNTWQIFFQKNMENFPSEIHDLFYLLNT